MSKVVLEKLASIYGATPDDYIPVAPQVPYGDLKRFYKMYLKEKSGEEKTSVGKGVVLPAAIMAAIGGGFGGLANGVSGAAVGATVMGGLGALLYGISKAMDDKEIEKAKQLVDMSDTSYDFKRALNEEIDNRYLREKERDRAASRSAAGYGSRY
jgi:hypothetical protein